MTKFQHSTLPAPRLVVTTIAPNGTSGVSQDASLSRGASNPNLSSVWKTVGLPSDAQAPMATGAGPGTGTLINPGSHAGVLDLPPSFSGRLHRSEALGYAVLLSGALALELDDGSTTQLEAGDILVQRASMHAWHNRGKTWARMLFVMLPTKPMEVDGKILKPAFT